MKYTQLWIGHALELYESLCRGKRDGSKLLINTLFTRYTFSSSSTYSSTSLLQKLLAMAM